MLNVDEYPDNADWLRGAQAFPFGNAGALVDFLRLSKMTPERFRALPVYTSNVDKIPWLRDFDFSSAAEDVGGDGGG